MSKLRMAAAGFAIAAVGAAGVFAGVSIAGATSQVFRIAVNSNGTKEAGSKGVHSARLTVGEYSVTFPKDVSNCIAVESLSRNDHSIFVPTAGEVGAAYLSGNPKGFFVETRDSAGNAADRDFMMNVTCKT
jgi:hypothetical protein